MKVQWMLAWLAICQMGLSIAEDQPVVVSDASVSGHVHPSICQTPNGDLVIVYRGKGILMVTRSTDSGDTWEPPKPLETSAVRPAEIREVSKFEIYPGTADTLPDGRVLVTWNYIADDKQTDGYYERALLYSLSEDQGRSWSDQALIGPIEGKHLGAVRHNVLPWEGQRWLLPLRVGPPRLYDPATGVLSVFPVVGPDGKQQEYQQIVRTSQGTLLAMGPALLRSTDHGQSWKEVTPFPGDGANRDNLEGRYLTVLADGKVLVTWGVGNQNKGLSYNLSTDDGASWGTKSTVLLPELPIPARYYSARTIQISDEEIGTVFLSSNRVQFLKVDLDRIANPGN